MTHGRSLSVGKKRLWPTGRNVLNVLGAGSGNEREHWGAGVGIHPILALKGGT